MWGWKDNAFLRWSVSRWVSHFLNSWKHMCLFSPQQTISLCEIQHPGQCTKTLVDMNMEKSMRMTHSEWVMPIDGSLQKSKYCVIIFLLNNLYFGFAEKSMPFEEWMDNDQCQQVVWNFEKLIGKCFLYSESADGSVVLGSLWKPSIHACFHLCFVHHGITHYVKFYTLDNVPKHLLALKRTN